MKKYIALVLALCFALVLSTVTVFAEGGTAYPNPLQDVRDGF